LIKNIEEIKSGKIKRVACMKKNPDYNLLRKNIFLQNLHKYISKKESGFAV